MPEQIFPPENLQDLSPMNPEAQHKDASELLEYKQKQAESRFNLSEQGTHADLQRLERSKKDVLKNDEAQTHSEAGFPMPLKAKDEAEKAQIANKMLEYIDKRIDHADGDPSEMINLLGRLED